MKVSRITMRKRENHRREKGQEKEKDREKKDSIRNKKKACQTA
jgi:hypothetical protein